MLTNEEIVGDAQHASTSFEELPRVVKPDDKIFLNDGLVQLVVQGVVRQRRGVHRCCRRRVTLTQRTEPSRH